jgi:hypothetical protein
MSSGQNSFLLRGAATAYVGTWTPWPVQMEPMRCPETSVNYQHTLLTIPTERRPQMYRERSLKPRNVTNCLV